MNIRLSTIYSLVLLLVYMNLSLSVGSDLLVFAMAILILTMFFVNMTKFDYLLLGSLFFYQCLILVLAWNQYSELPYLFGAVVQFSSSIFLGVITFRLLSSSDLLASKKFLPRVLIIFFILLILELTDVTRGMSNAYRQTFLGVSSEIISMEQARDIEMTHWFIRPNLFAKEASMAYLFFFTISSCYVVQKKSVKAILFLSILNVILFFIYRTPSVGLTLIMYFLLVFFFKYDFFTKLKKTHILCFYLVTLIAVLLFKGLILERFSDIDFDDVNRMNSITIRVVAPLHFMLRSVADYPFFGIGLGNLDFFKSKNIAVGNNALFYFISFSGIIGTLVSLFLLISWLIKEGLNRFKDIIIVVSFFVLLSLQTGGILNFRMWFYFFTFVAYYKYSLVSRRKQKEL